MDAEIPGRLDERVAFVRAHMRPQDDARAACLECRSQARGLRIVEDHDVARTNPAFQGHGVRYQRGLVDTALPLPELAAVTGVPVYTVLPAQDGE